MFSSDSDGSNEEEGEEGEEEFYNSDDDDDEIELSPEEEAAIWKQEGNEKYKIKDYFGSIDAYTKAIEIMPEDHTYYGNRSAANMMIGRYEHVERDCVKALELNKNYIKC